MSDYQYWSDIEENYNKTNERISWKNYFKDSIYTIEY